MEFIGEPFILYQIVKLEKKLEYKWFLRTIFSRYLFIYTRIYQYLVWIIISGLKNSNIFSFPIPSVSESGNTAEKMTTPNITYTWHLTNRNETD